MGRDGTGAASISQIVAWTSMGGKACGDGAISTWRISPARYQPVAVGAVHETVFDTLVSSSNRFFRRELWPAEASPAVEQEALLNQPVIPVCTILGGGRTGSAKRKGQCRPSPRSGSRAMGGSQGRTRTYPRERAQSCTYKRNARHGIQVQFDNFRAQTPTWSQQCPCIAGHRHAVGHYVDLIRVRPELRVADRPQ